MGTMGRVGFLRRQWVRVRESLCGPARGVVDCLRVPFQRIVLALALRARLLHLLRQTPTLSLVLFDGLIALGVEMAAAVASDEDVLLAALVVGLLQLRLQLLQLRVHRRAPRTRHAYTHTHTRSAPVAE